jgi:hypothetical protein
MKYRISSRFGEMESFRQKGHSHTGIDFVMSDGEPLRTIQPGTIERIVDYGNFNAGKTIFVKWEDGKTAIYGHLSRFTDGLKEGDKVQAGDLIGFSGHSGHVVSSHGGNGAHLHFGLKNANGQFIDPSPYIDLIQNMNTPGYLVNKTEIIQQSVQQGMQFNDFIEMHSEALNKIAEYLQFKFIYMLNHFVDIIAVVINMI